MGAIARLENGMEITEDLRPLWHATRSDPSNPVLTASRFAAAAGIDPYTTPLDLFLQLTGRGPQTEEKAFMRRGHHLQKWCLQEYAIATGDAVAKEEVWHWGPILNGIRTGATLDAITESGRLIECKSHNWRMREMYGEPGTDQVPPHVYTQTIGQMIIGRVNAGSVVAAIDGEDEPLVYPIPINLDDADTLLAAADRFCWHLANDKAPEPTAPEDMRLMRFAIRLEERRIDLDSVAGKLIEEINEINALMKPISADLRALEERAKVAKARLAALMGGATHGYWRTHEVTVKHRSRKAYMAAESSWIEVSIKPAK